ncbi:hypothetical protein [Chondrinema litorale]|uniref:hypothetical protein n=1 Tax=Chondrinema litorale TaxID=2994555 RepID=UPI002543E542|nr:hypothetical protein [Chondrinema litorale]UZR95156.1 hypothetical protein OQ292_04910 [Chondrinema litorale]
MNKLRNLLAIIALFSSLFVVTSCDDDDDPAVVERPSISSSSASASVITGNSAALTFNVTVPGGYASSTISAGNIDNEPEVGSTSGTITASFTPTSAGTTTITLTVTDQQSSSKTESISVDVIANDPVAGAPLISGIPATATISVGDTLGGEATGDIEVILTAEAGISSFTLSVNDGAEAALGAYDGSATADTIDVYSLGYAPTEAGTYVLDFTLTDADGETAQVTHVLTVDDVEYPTSIISDNIEENTTWYADTVYELAGRIAVLEGAVLTIQAGTIIKGQAGSGSNATALLIARGGTLNAEGSPTQPIIFTTVSDQIAPGQIASPNMLPTDSGLWGGLIILGKAPIAADAESIQIEGIPPSDTNGLYGGTDPDDSSGTIQYVSIRHGGANIGEGNEINGITLGGVGRGTTIDHIEVIGNQDDGIEFFGGTVDVNDVLIWNAGDDSFDYDQGISGTLDNFIGILGPDSDHALELDGPEGTVPANISGSFTIQNGSIKGSLNATGGEYADLRSDIRGELNNIYFFNFKSSSDVEFDNNGVSQNYIDELINLSTLQFNVSHLSEGNLTVEAIFQEKVATDDDGVATEDPLGIFTERPLDSTIDIVTTPTVGADKAEFSGWTWADYAGELADF